MVDFTHSAALWGLLAAATPVVIYLILRRRKTEVPWGAGYLLRRTLASRRKASVWLQYLILAIRCLLLALAALLISEPFRSRAEPDLSAPEPPAQPVHRVILIDHSISMSAAAGHDTRQGRLRAALRGLLRSQRPGDAATLVSLLHPAASPGPRSWSGPLRPDDWEAALTFGPLEEGPIRLPDALAATVKAFARTPSVEAELYLFSDFPREIAADLRHLEWFPLARAARIMRIAPVNLADRGERGMGHVALTQASFGSDFAIAGIPATLYLRAVNFSETETAANIRITGSQTLARSVAASLQPDESRLVPVEIRLDKPGIETLQASAAPSRLPAASEIHVTVEVKDRLHVWLLADPADVTRPGTLGEAEFLRRALMPAGPDPGPIELTDIELLQICQPIPDSIDLILLAGPRLVTPAVREPLLRFLRRGGGLLIAASPALDPSFYNPNLAGILPAVLDTAAASEVNPERFQSLRFPLASPQASLLAEFADTGAEIADARFYNALRIASLSPDASVLLRFSDQQPLLISSKLHRGNVLLFNSSLGVSWSSLPVRQSYLAFLHRLMHLAAAGRASARNLLPGEPFVAAWPAREVVTLTRPDGREESVPLTESAGQNFVVLGDLSARGPWRLHGSSGHAQPFTVTGVPPEADLRTLGEAERRQIESLLGAPVYPDWPSAVRALGPPRAGNRLWPWLLIAVLLLYLVETRLVRYL
ncbi:MAG: VWA domain-containing protein [Planctomycetes bacterium]|nr:VWA domain-containing protein [Planctomycetota bacterium]